jgi:predicted PurR-regulated permease PerM
VDTGSREENALTRKTLSDWIGATMPVEQNDSAIRDRFIATWVELAIRLGVLGLLLYWSFILISPFTTIAAWSVVLTVALYPVYDWMVIWLGGRRRLAGALLTFVCLMVVIGPATWLVLGLIDSLRTLSTELDVSAVSVPPPAESVRTWPLIGKAVYQFWHLASTNLQAALVKIAPQLKPLGGNLLQIAADAGAGMIKLIAAIVISGFLFAPAPRLMASVRQFSLKLASGRGEHFVALAGATIRNVSRGVVGISILQALLAGVGFSVAGIPGASLMTSAVLVLGIIQIGPSVLILPVIVWSWMSLDATTALLFTLYMIPVNLLDNVLRPIVMARGLATPMVVILIGVIGGALSFGITGLFLGPITLAVIWELMAAWINESNGVEAVPAETN